MITYEDIQYFQQKKENAEKMRYTILCGILYLKSFLWDLRKHTRIYIYKIDKKEKTHYLNRLNNSL